ncbi:MAG: hypothetical protein ACJA13_002650, partial [Paraglaciecola sp.]
TVKQNIVRCQPEGCRQCLKVTLEQPLTLIKHWQVSFIY